MAKRPLFLLLFLKLTQLGKRSVEKINQLSIRSVQEVLDSLNERDQKKVASAFQKLAQAIQRVDPTCDQTPGVNRLL